MFGFLQKASSATAIKISFNELNRLDKALANLKTGREIFEEQCKEAIYEFLPRYLIDDAMLKAYAYATYDPELNGVAFQLQREALKYPDNDAQRETIGVCIALLSAMGASKGTKGRDEAIGRALKYCGV